MGSKKDVLRHEFVGLQLSVEESSNKIIQGIQGKIINEKKNAFMIRTSDGKEKIILKKGSTFKITNKKTFLIKGDLLIAKPEDRIKMKVK